MVIAVVIRRRLVGFKHDGGSETSGELLPIMGRDEEKV
jgi:hypothetical protein